MNSKIDTTQGQLFSELDLDETQHNDKKQLLQIKFESDKASSILPLLGGDATLFRSCLGFSDAQALFTYFHDNLAWQQASIQLFGKRQIIPRLQAWYGDANTAYRYSGLLMQPLAWDPIVLHIKHLCEQHCNTRFNSVLANLYRNGEDSMGMHADDEPELGNSPIIASFSLGQTRRFSFKNKQSKETYRIDLAQGDLLVMSGDTQKNWLHGMNKSRTQTGPRINLTYRFVHG